MATQLDVIDYGDSNARRARPFLAPPSPVHLPSNASNPWTANANKLSSSPEKAPNRFDNNGISVVTPQPPIKTNPLLKPSNLESEAGAQQQPSNSNPSQNQSRSQSPIRFPKSHSSGRNSYVSGDESQPPSRRNSEDSPLSVLSTYFDAQKEHNDTNENQNPSQANPIYRSDSLGQKTSSFVEAVRRNDVAAANEILQNSNAKKRILDGIHPATGYTALTLSIVEGNETLCRRLLEWGSDPNVKDASQVPPLIHAVKGNREEIVKILLKKCAFINVVDPHNRTPLHYACEKNNRSIVKILLVAGANILSKDENGYSPLQLSDSAFIQALFKKHCERHGIDYAEVASEVQTPRSPSVFSFKDLDSRSERSLPETRSESRSGFSDSEFGGRREDLNHSFGSDSSTDTLMERTEASLLDMAILAAKLGKLENFDIDSLIQELSLMKNNRDAVALKSKLESLQNRKEKAKDKSRDFERIPSRNEVKDAKEKGESRMERFNGNNPLRIITNDPLSVDNAFEDHQDLPMMSAGISRRRQTVDSANEESSDKQQKMFAFKPTPPPSPPPSSIAGGVVQADFHRNQFAPPTELKPSRVSPRMLVRDHAYLREWDGMKFDQSSWAEYSGNETDVSGVNGTGYAPYPSTLRRTTSGLPSSGYNSNMEDAGHANFRGPGLGRRNPGNPGVNNTRERLGRTLSGTAVFSPDQKFSNLSAEGENLEEAVLVGGMYRPGERFENSRGGRMMGRWEEDGEDWGRNDQDMDFYYYRTGNLNQNNVVPDGAYYGMGREEFRRQPSYPSSTSSSRRTSPRNEPKPPPLSRSGSTSSAYSNHHFEEGSGAKLFRSRPGTRPTPLRLRPAINLPSRNEKFGMYSDSEYGKYNGVVHKPVPPNPYQNPSIAPFNPNPHPNQNLPGQSPYANVNDSPDPYASPNVVFSPSSQPPSPPPYQPLSPSLLQPQPQSQPQIRRDAHFPVDSNANISPTSNPSPKSGMGDDHIAVAERERKGPSNEDLLLIRADWREDAAKGGCVACGKVDCEDRACLTSRDSNEEEPSPSSASTGAEMDSRSFDKNSSNSMPTNFKWKKGELLGEGAYGKVFAGLNQTTGELMAVKQLKILDAEQRSSHMDALEREISLYKTMRHKHIVGYIGMEKDVASGSLYVFLEFVSGGSIHSMLERFGKFSESLVRVYTRQLLLGLEYLHRCKIIHRDIKGGNVLVDRDGVVKLADFGASKAFNDTTFTDGFKSIRGSVFWMAPEVIKGDGYGRRADIWSVGCTVVEMLTATHPWPDIDNTWAAIFHIAKTTTGPPIPEDCSDDAKDFLNSCFHLDAKKRFSASELLKHPFVASVPDIVRDMRPHAAMGN